MQSYIVEHANQTQLQTSDWTELINGLRFVSNGKYVSGYVDSSQDLVRLLETYQAATDTSFSTGQNLIHVLKTIDEGQLQMRFMSPASRPRLFWQMNAGEPTIPYDGVPFMSIGHGTDLTCVRFGGRRKKSEQVSLPSGDMVPVDYRMKTGCEAKVTIRRILRYPCAEYHETMVQGIAAVRRHRKQNLDALVQRIITGTAKAQERIHFLLPTPVAHIGHIVPEIDGPAPIDQQVLDQIIHELGNGVTGIVQLRDRIKNFIITRSVTDSSIHNMTNQMYCPTEFDIFRQVYWLYKMGQVIDQDTTLKNSMGLGIEQTLSQAVSQTTTSLGVTERKPSLPTTTTSSSDVITNVYSIIMDENPADGASPLDQLNDHQMSTDHEVELNSSENAHNLGVIEESPMVNQMQIGISSSTIAPSVQVQVSGSGNHAHIIKRPMSQGNLTPMKVISSKPITASVSNLRNTTAGMEASLGTTIKLEVSNIIVIYVVINCNGTSQCGHFLEKCVEVFHTERNAIF